MSIQIVSFHPVVHLDKAVNRLGHVPNLDKSAISIASRIIPYTAGHELCKRYEVAALVILEPLRHVFPISLEIFNHSVRV